MLEERLKELIKKFELKDEKAITFGHPKMKTKQILPLLGVTVYSFEQFQPFFIYFDKEGISFFPLDMNNKYNIIGKSFMSWNDLKRFNFKKGLIMEDEIQLQLENDKIEMKISYLERKCLKTLTLMQSFLLIYDKILLSSYKNINH